MPSEYFVNVNPEHYSEVDSWCKENASGTWEKEKIRVEIIPDGDWVGAQPPNVIYFSQWAVDSGFLEKAQVCWSIVGWPMIYKFTDKADAAIVKITWGDE